MTLAEKSKNIERIGQESQNHEISKYCKNIGMQKSTLKKMLIIPGRHGFLRFLLHESKL